MAWTTAGASVALGLVIGCHRPAPVVEDTGADEPGTTKPEGFVEYDPASCDLLGVDHLTTQLSWWVEGHSLVWYVYNDDTPADMLAVEWPAPSPTAPHEAWIGPGVQNASISSHISIQCEWGDCGEKYWSVTGHVVIEEGGEVWGPLRGTVDHLMLDEIVPFQEEGPPEDYLEGGRRWCVEHLEMDTFIEELPI